MVTLDMIKDAQNVIAKDVRRTDLFLAANISEENEIYLKTENLQVTGSFKARGSAYKISSLTDEEKAKGIIACSAGNHAQGVARAAQKNNIKCKICMPSTAPVTKVAATESYGAEALLVKDTFDDAYAKAVQLQKETGATFVHPFNDEYIIAGQGTIGIEVLEQLPEADAVITSIGGGGLLAGIAVAVKAINPNCKVYGVQAANAAAMYNSFKEKKLTTTNSSDTFADGIAVKAPGDITYDLISKYVDDIATVSEDEIAAAILMLLEKQKVVSEGAGAASVAAAYFNKFNLKGKKIVCIVSGGNIDVNILNRVIARGLIMSGRKTSVTIALPDKPGMLNKACAIIGDLGGNILEVYHSNSDPNMPISSCFVRFLIETRSAAHAQQIKDSFVANGLELKDKAI